MISLFVHVSGSIVDSIRAACRFTTMKIYALFVLLACGSMFAADTPVVRKMGWKSSPTHMKGMRQFANKDGYDPKNLPDKVSLAPLMPDAYDQGSEGSCVANASLAAFELQWKRQNGEFLLGSRQGIYRDLLIHDGSYPEDAGSYTSSAVWVLKNKGVGLEKCYPYREGSFKTPPKECYAGHALQHVAVAAYDVDSTDGVSIRVALAQGYPVVYGGYIYQNIYALDYNNFVLPMPKGKPIGGHEEVIVGYDSTMEWTYPDGRKIKGFYLIQNSWGKSFGRNGRYWAPMKYIENPRYNNDFAVFSVTSTLRK